MLYFFHNSAFAGWALPTAKPGYYLYIVGQCPTYKCFIVWVYNCNSAFAGWALPTAKQGYCLYIVWQCPTCCNYL